MTDTEYYDDTVADEEDELLDGEEDLGSLDPYFDTLYNLEVVSCKKKTLQPRDGVDEEPQGVIQIQLMITEGEFEGERSFHTFWIGPRGIAKEARHKRARKAFNKFFEACTGESIGKGSTANPRDCEGASISGKWVDASYTNRDGQTMKEGEGKWDDFAWSTPIATNGEWDGEEPI